MNRRTADYGPWSSSLHPDGRMELSAFWKRRMSALSRLPQSSWPMRRRWLAASLSLVALAVCSPLWRLSPQTAAADENGAYV
jgi:hypothetical protein